MPSHQSKRRILITSALPYINGVKHLGNLAGSMLPADVYARVMRLKGHEVLYICGTDEHGTPAEIAAENLEISVSQFCDEQYELQRKSGEGFSLSYDWFGRSSCKHNHQLTQHFAAKLAENGLIEEKISEQVYSIDDKRFLPDRYVEGTCPHCKFESARGDQCDSCGRVLDPIELKDPYAVRSGSKNIEIRETLHLFLKQSKMQETIRNWVERSTHWPILAKSIATKWLDEGLRDRSITRDLSWGIPVCTPDGEVKQGFENKVFYVWFDAPIEYISATQEWAESQGNLDAWKQFWRNDHGAEETEYVQFMGKDNVAFHTVSFPVTLFGSKEPWKTVDKLKAFNWVTWYGNKFSTSKRRGVFMDQAIEILPADYWRWYLTANAPEGSDTTFTWEGFQTSINSDLANTLGNFVNRITKFCYAKFDGHIPSEGDAGDLEQSTEQTIKDKLQKLSDNYESMEFRKAAQETRAIWALGNEYLTLSQPWTQIKTDVSSAAVSVRSAINLAVVFAIIAHPIVPNLAQTILDALGVSESNRKWPELYSGSLLDIIPRNQPISVPDLLVRKIEDSDVAKWTEMFEGTDMEED